LGAVRAFVGTEAVLHRVRRATLVAFLDFDQHLLAPRFGGAEESLALLARAGRLVGGRGRGIPGHPVGRVLVQTRLPDHEVLRAAVEGDPGVLAAHELDLRRELSLPPVGALGLVSGSGAERFAVALGEVPGVDVADLGDGRWMVRAGATAVLCDALAAVPRPSGRLRVEVDPTAL
jgi:primosomal protein N' (replication factor Y)